MKGVSKCHKFETKTLNRARGGGSFIVKVPGGVPLARVYFFKLSSLAKGIRFANFCLGKGMLFRNFGQRNVKPR